MNEEDYVKLHELLAKIDVIIAKDDLDSFYCSTEEHLKRICDLRQGVKLIKENIYVEIERN